MCNYYPKVRHAYGLHSHSCWHQNSVDTVIIFARLNKQHLDLTTSVTVDTGWCLSFQSITANIQSITFIYLHSSTILWFWRTASFFYLLKNATFHWPLFCEWHHIFFTLVTCYFSVNWAPKMIWISTWLAGNQVESMRWPSKSSMASSWRDHEDHPFPVFTACCDFGLRHAHIEAVDEDQSIPGMSHLETDKVGWSQRWGTPKFVASY